MNAPQRPARYLSPRRPNKETMEPQNQRRTSRRGVRPTRSFERPRPPPQIMRSNTNPNATLRNKSNELLTTFKQKLHPKEPQHGSIFDCYMERLSYSPQDIQSIAFDDDEAFRTLKASLRQRGCVTNAYLKENVHFYVRHVKDIRQQRIADEAREQRRRLRRRTSFLTQHTPHNAAA